MAPTCWRSFLPLCWNGVPWRSFAFSRSRRAGCLVIAAETTNIDEVMHQMSQVLVDLSNVAAKASLLAANYKQMFSNFVPAMKEVSRELALLRSWREKRRTLLRMSLLRGMWRPMRRRGKQRWSTLKQAKTPVEEIEIKDDEPPAETPGKPSELPTETHVEEKPAEASHGGGVIGPMSHSSVPRRL